MSQQGNSTDLATQLNQFKQKEQANRENEIRLRTERDNIARELEQVQKRAQEEFGTCDLAQMRSQYAQYVQEDRAAITEFASKVNHRTALLENIQKRLDAHRAGKAGNVA